MTTSTNYQQRLIEGIKTGQADLVESCLQHLGNNINTMTCAKTRRSVFSMSVVYGHKNVIKCLIRKNAQINKTDPDGKAALTIAVIKGDLEIIKLLISKGANLNQMDNSGNTPLTTALQQNKNEIAKFLITKGANVNKSGPNEKTPLSWAVYNDEEEMIKLLLDHGAHYMIHSALLEAIRCRNLNVVRLLKERGAAVNLDKVSGYSPLIKAIEIEHFEIVKYLVEQGANVNQKDGQERSPLSIAAANRDLCTFDYLVKAGADINEAIAEIERIANANVDFVIYLNSLKESKAETEVKRETEDIVIYN